MNEDEAVAEAREVAQLPEGALDGVLERILETAGVSVTRSPKGSTLVTRRSNAGTRVGFDISRGSAGVTDIKTMGPAFYARAERSDADLLIVGVVEQWSAVKYVGGGREIAFLPIPELLVALDTETPLETLVEKVGLIKTLVIH